MRVIDPSLCYDDIRYCEAAKKRFTERSPADSPDCHAFFDPETRLVKIRGRPSLFAARVEGQHVNGFSNLKPELEDLGARPFQRGHLRII